MDEVLPGTPEQPDGSAPESGIAPPAVDPSTPAQPTEPEQFIDPRDFPPELQPHWKRMQAAYTKKTQAIARDRDKIELVNRYRSDPNFALQFMQQELQRMGAAPQPQQPQHQPTNGQVPPAFVDAIASRLPQELRWMAPAMAEATYASVAHLTAPIVKQTQDRAREERETEWDTLAQQLSERQPGWEAHEDEMLAMNEFLTSGKLKHPTYGSKLDILLNLVTGGAAATQRAIQRMSDAGRQRTTTGQPSRTTVPNITDRVRSAKTTHDAFQVAAQAAIAQIQSGGA